MERKVLIVGQFPENDRVYCYERAFENAFKKLNYAVETFNTRCSYIPGVSKVFYQMNRFEKILSRYLMNRALKSTIERNAFDFVFFIKPDTVFPSTLFLIKEKKIRLVCFYPDNPFVFWNGNSNSFVLEGLPLFDDYLIWSQLLIDQLYAAGARSVSYFPFGFDKDILVQDAYIKEACDVSFVGTWEPERAWWLEELIKRSPRVQLGIWGDLWEKGLSVDSPLRPYLKGASRSAGEMVSIFKVSKIVLNFIRQQNRGSHNMRTIEVPACGAFLLTERTYEQANYLFSENESIACFATPNELVEKIEYFLTHVQERERIALNGFEVVQQYELTKLLDVFLKGVEHDFTKTKNCHFSSAPF